MMDSAVKAGNILPLVDKYEVSGNSNSLKWVDIDETSVATTVFGGVQVYWGSEASQVTAKKPQLIERKMELERLMGVAYATYELDSDSNFISQLYQKAFTIAITRELENCVINGTGAGKPLGILKSSALVSVAKEAGQAASTVMYENMVKMYNRALDKSSSAWVIHPDVQEQLDFMSFPVGVGGVPVYLPASSQGALATLKGRPIVESDQCSALGTLGDINFVDLAQYMLITKGGVQSDVSIHVQFLTAENCFRFIFRANGMPKKNTALTIKNSSNTRSSIVSLATRA
jgi:HK97 family phage major capsid protein